MLVIPGNGSDAVTIKDDSDRRPKLTCSNMAFSPTALPMLPDVSEGLESKGDMYHLPAKPLHFATMKRVRRIIIAVAGTTVLTLGIALLVLPGPAFLVIPAGLGILAIEFAWARRWLRTARGWIQGDASANGAYSVAAQQPNAAGNLWRSLKARIGNTMFSTALALLLFAGAALMAFFAVWRLFLKVSRQVGRRLRNAVDLLRRGHSLPGSMNQANHIRLLSERG
jgi:hypothetical protein